MQFHNAMNTNFNFERIVNNSYNQAVTTVSCTLQDTLLEEEAKSVVITNKRVIETIIRLLVTK